jgi:uncharacterized protein YqhQ
MVICVRQPDNEILTHIEEINSLSERHKLLSLPFVRGIIALFETFYLGVKGLNFSANAVLEEEEKLSSKEFAIVIALSLGLSSFFFVVPFLLTTLFKLQGVLFNIVESIVRFLLFLLYLTLVSMWADFKRILQYHGAEHKTINAFEAKVSLKVVNVKNFSRIHPRCGTSFILIVMFISILLFSIMPNLGFYMRLAYRVLLIPFIGALSYELLKLSDRYKDSSITRILTLPGMAFQRLTTREPDDDMVEVAIKALETLRSKGS